MARPHRRSTPPPPGPTLAEVCADFEPHRLAQARQLAMLGRGDLAEAVGVPAWQVLHWEVISARCSSTGRAGSPGATGSAQV